MTDIDLVRAVDGFAQATRGVSDADLARELPWQGLRIDVRWQFYRIYEDLRGLAAEVLAERSGGGASISVAQAILGWYHAAYRDLQGLLLQVDDGDLDRAPSDGEWSLRQVLGHVVGTDFGFLALVHYARERWREGDKRPLQMPREEFEQMQKDVPSTAGSLREILARWDALHERILGELSGVADAELQAPIGFWYEADVRFQLARFEAHLREHTIQIEKLLEVIKPRPSDALRTLREIYRALGEAEGAALGAPEAAAERRRNVASAIATRGAELMANS